MQQQMVDIQVYVIWIFNVSKTTWIGMIAIMFEND